MSRAVGRLSSATVITTVRAAHGGGFLESLEARRLLSGTIFINPNPITINDTGDGSATPYPSTIDVSGLSGTISSMTVTLNGFGHSFPKDVDMLLVSPGGTNAVIFSDVGAGFSVSGLTITLDDAAANPLPESSALGSGTFRPTNVNGNDGDQFPSPAPASQGNVSLGNFSGSNPNGTWQLFVYDDSAGDDGLITGGWSMAITTGAGAPNVPSSPALSPGSDSGIFNDDGVTNDNTPTLAGTADAGVIVHVLDGATEVGSATADSSGNWTVTTTALADGTHPLVAYATNGQGSSADSPVVHITIDTTRPTLVSPGEFQYLTGHSVQFTFSEDVGLDLDAADLGVMNLTTGTTVATSAIDAAFATPVAAFTFPGEPNGVLPDGNYHATLSGTGTADRAGNTLAADASLDFFVLTGDANHDKRVDTLDFNSLAANFGGSGKDYSQADFNYDGKVDTLDFNNLAANFGKSLPAASRPAPAATVVAPATAANLVFSHDVIRLHPATRDDGSVLPL